jgi:hypothetical protein
VFLCANARQRDTQQSFADVQLTIQSPPRPTGDPTVWEWGQLCVGLDRAAGWNSSISHVATYISLEGRVSNVRVVSEVRGRRQRAQWALAYGVHYGLKGQDTRGQVWATLSSTGFQRTGADQGAGWVNASSDKVLDGLEAVRRRRSGHLGKQNESPSSLNKTPTHRIASLRLITSASLRLHMCPARFAAKRIRLCYRAHGCQPRPTAWSSFDMSSTLVMSCTRRNVFGPLRLCRPRRVDTGAPGCRVDV